MNIQISENALIKLTAWAIATNGLEFSGFGIVERDKNIRVVDVDLLNVGSYGFTKIPPHRQLSLPYNPNRKVWFHRHPISGWSGIDSNTAEREPFGVDPKLVKWSTSIVLTPNGWIGRVDIYEPSLKTYHLEVFPKFPSPEIIEQSQKLITPELMKYIAELKEEFDKMGYGGMSEDFDDYEPKILYKKLKKRRIEETPEIWIGGKQIFRRIREALEL